MASMVFDLLPYVPLMGEEARREVSSHLEVKVSEVSDKIRKARASLSLHKVNKVLGVLKHNDENVAKLH